MLRSAVPSFYLKPIKIHDSIILKQNLQENSNESNFNVRACKVSTVT